MHGNPKSTVHVARHSSADNEEIVFDYYVGVVATIEVRLQFLKGGTTALLGMRHKSHLEHTWKYYGDVGGFVLVDHWPTSADDGVELHFSVYGGWEGSVACFSEFVSTHP